MKKFDRSLPRKARAVTTTDAEGGGEVLSFVLKAYRLCSYLDKNHPAVAGWDKDGEHFEVYNTKQLEGFFQPDYFSHSKFQSFTRQLNMHGFRKLRVDRRGIEASFFHPVFKRNGFELLNQIKRQEHLVDAAGGGESGASTSQLVPSIYLSAIYPSVSNFPSTARHLPTSNLPTHLAHTFHLPPSSVSRDAGEDGGHGTHNIPPHAKSCRAQHHGRPARQAQQVLARGRQH